MKYITYFRDTPNTDQMGEIGSAIAKLYQNNFLTPPGFILTPDAFQASLTQEHLEKFSQLWKSQQIDIGQVQQLLNPIYPSEAIQLQILQALAELFPYGGLFAVRPSPIYPETHPHCPSLKAFFAVPPEDLNDKIAMVWRSMGETEYLSFRQKHHNYPLPHPPAILVQQMLNSPLSGSAYGADPVTGRRNITMITAVYGLSQAQAGNPDADTFYLHRSGRMIQRHLAYKRSAYQVNQHPKTGITIQPVPPEKAAQPALDDTQIQAIASLTRRVGQTLASPQSLDWAIYNHQVYILQTQPLQTQPTPPQPSGQETLWDHRLFSPHYPPLTKPLTFSCLRQSHSVINQQFCDNFRVSFPLHSFEQLMGFLEGKVYYNLTQLKGILQQFPSLLRDHPSLIPLLLGEDFAGGITSKVSPVEMGSFSQKKQGNIFTQIKTAWLLFKQWLAYPGKYRQLQRKLEVSPDYSAYSLEDLIQYYRILEEEILPLAVVIPMNTLFAALGYSGLRSLCGWFCQDTESILPNFLLQSPTNAPSLLADLREFGTEIARHGTLVKLLSEAPLEAILAALGQHPDLQSRYEAFLDQWGSLSFFPLDVEQNSFKDNPLPLFRILALWGETVSDPPPSAEVLILRRSLRTKPFHRWLLQWVVKQTQQRMSDRIALYLAQTRLSQTLHHLFLEVGQRFFVFDLVKNPQDIFYLEIEEISQLVEGRGTCNDSKSLANLREGELNSYGDRFFHCDRVLTQTIPSRHIRAFSSPSESPTTDMQQGISCAGGNVRAIVRCLSSPQDLLHLSSLPHNVILVSASPYPSWCYFFPLFSGLIFNEGTPLSLLAILAREYNIPMVTSVTNVTQWLHDGDWIELDGNTGRVSRFVLGNG